MLIPGTHMVLVGEDEIKGTDDHLDSGSKEKLKRQRNTDASDTDGEYVSKKICKFYRIKVSY